MSGYTKGGVQTGRANSVLDAAPWIVVSRRASFAALASSTCRKYTNVYQLLDPRIVVQSKAPCFARTAITSESVVSAGRFPTQRVFDGPSSLSDSLDGGGLRWSEDPDPPAELFADIAGSAGTLDNFYGIHEILRHKSDENRSSGKISEASTLIR